MNEAKNTKLNIMGILLAVASFVIMCLGFLFTVRYMLLRQHVSPSDGDYFKDGGIWVNMLKAISGIFGMNVLQFAHAVMPAAFLVLFVFLYFAFGLYLFRKDGKGFLYIFLMNCMFVSIIFVILHVCYFSPGSLEAGVYINPWQGQVVTGMLLTPLLVMLLSSIEKGEDNRIKLKSKTVICLILLLIAFLLIHGIDAWKKLRSGGFSFDYMKGGWLMLLAFAGIAAMLAMKKPAAIALVIASLVDCILLIPLPLGIIAAYSFTELIGEIICSSKNSNDNEVIYEINNKRSILAGFVYVVILVTILSAGLFSKSRVSWNINFSPIENDERLPKGVSEALKAAEDDAIYTSYDIASVIKQKDTVSGNDNRSVYGLWNDSPMKGHDISGILDGIRDENMCVIIKNVTEEDRTILLQNKLWFVEDFDGYSVYRR